jgi:hypothetical protein
MRAWSLMLTLDLDGQPIMYSRLGTKHTVTELSASLCNVVGDLDLGDRVIRMDPTETVLTLELLAAIKSIRGKEVEMVTK